MQNRAGIKLALVTNNGVVMLEDRTKTAPSGVGGWLAFLIIVLMVLGPLLSLGSVYSEISGIERLQLRIANESDWWLSKLALWCLTVVPVAISFSVGYHLWRDHRPETVEFAISGLWAMVALSFLSNFIVAFGIFNLSFEAVANALMKNAFSIVVAVGVWTLYLRKSIRVKNTYGVSDQSTALSQGLADPPSDDGHDGVVSTNAERSIVMVLKKGGWWRRQSKPFRLWVFSSILWIVVFLLYVFVAEPYGRRIKGDEVLDLVSWLFIPPLLVGSAYYAYVRFVR